MEILGVGWQELIFIFIIALIVLGPKDMQKAGTTIAKWIRSILMSDVWMGTQRISGEVKKQWTHFIREANEDLNKINKEVNIAGDLKDSRVVGQNKTPLRSVPTGSKYPPASEGSNLSPLNVPENTIQPPAAKPASAEDGTGSSSTQDSAENTNTEEHD